MRRQAVGLAILALAFASMSFAQTSPSAAGAGVPPVIRFTGTLAVAPGRVPVTFGLYQHDTGGDPLWSETQTLIVDAAGRYAVVLGLATALPAGLFASGEARWLDVAVEGVAPEPRRLLVSVPYALKAADAETVGGKPLSAFVLAGQRTGVGPDGLTYVDTRVLASGMGGPPSPAGGPPSPAGGFGAAGGAGTANYLGMFGDETTLVNSVIYQTPTGNIGVNTTAPLAGFHAVSGASPTAYFDVYSPALGALPVVYRAARGTPASPAPVQTNDILGGLAVRGYGSTGFSAGRGQVMYKAAENWTDTAQGTYLQFTTTPTGATGWLERIRVTPDGRIGIGTSTPAHALSVSGTIESTAGGFRFPDGTTQATALSLAANTFTATQTIAGGNLGLAATTGADSGVLTLGGISFLHGYGATYSPNTFLGPRAGSFTGTGGGGNVGVGEKVLMANTAGAYNTAVGSQSMLGNTTGNSNSAVGYGSLWSNTTGVGNSAFGYQALLANNTAHFNTAFGYQALHATATSLPTSNSAFGAYALKGNGIGDYNTAVGRDALVANTTGRENAALGHAALVSHSSGTGNVGIGTAAGNNLVTGSYNSFIGYLAATDRGGIMYATAIGAYALVTRSNSLVLGGEAGGDFAVNVGIGTSAPDTTLQVVGDIKVGTSGTNGCLKNFDGTGIAGTCSSDVRLKQDIRPFEPMLDRVARLQPVRYSWRTAEFPDYHFGEGVSSGLIAQDVEQVFPNMVSTDERGYKMVNYSELPYLTLQALRDLKAENDRKDEQIRTLTAQLASLAERMAKFEKR
jgi:hypothetical protein